MKHIMKEEIINKTFFISGKLFEEISSNLYNILNLSLPPRAIQIYPTELCNLNCKMCFIRTIKKKFEELDFAIIKKLIKEVNLFKPLLSLSGGEPTIYRYFFETVKIIKKNSFDLTIVTNGVTLYNMAEFLVEMNVNKLKISIDGPPEIHNRIRGRNVFERIENGIKKINKIKNLKRKKYPELILHSVLNKNLDIDFLINFGKENNFKNLVFIPVLFLNKEEIENFYNETGFYPHYWKGSEFNIKEFIIDEKIVDKINETDFKISFAPQVQKNIKEYFERNKNYIDSFKGRCRSIFNSATIKPDGNLELCPDYVLGNLKNESFFRLWNNKAAGKIRRLIKSKKSLSVCIGCCAYYR